METGGLKRLPMRTMNDPAVDAVFTGTVAKLRRAEIGTARESGTGSLRIKRVRATRDPTGWRRAHEFLGARLGTTRYIVPGTTLIRAKTPGRI